MGILLPEKIATIRLDSTIFCQKLDQEFSLLKNIIASSEDSNETKKIGLEIESSLINLKGKPISYDLSRFNPAIEGKFVSEFADSAMEFCGPALHAQNDVFSKTQSIIKSQHELINQQLATTDIHNVFWGLLPTANETDYKIKALTKKNRYQIINKNIMETSGHKVKISDHSWHFDCLAMMGGASSYQINYSCPWSQVIRHYNAALLIAGPVLAISTNSPCFDKKILWHETRIPLLEKLFTMHQGRHESRVYFGNDYLHSLDEYFYPIIKDISPVLPYCYDESEEPLPHLRLQNSIVYPWVRLIIDFDRETQKLFFRIETRQLPSGPTISDMLSSSAFYIGLLHYYAMGDKPADAILPFEQAKKNFYQAAQHGYQATLYWNHGKTMSVPALIDHLLPLAEQGLHALNIDPKDIQHYLGILHEKNKRQCSGSNWQLATLPEHSYQEMTKRYIQNQANHHSLLDW